MAGAWEQLPPQVLIAILTREQVSTKWAQGFRELQVPPQSQIIFLAGMPFDHARNAACQTALQHNFTWLFFLDDDVIAPPDAIPKLMSRGQDIISGLYFRRAEPINMPVMLMDTKPKPSFITGFQPGSMIEADMVGAGCLLIHRRVLERVPPPKFEWTIDYDGIHNAIRTDESDRASEDFTFCRKCKRLGFKIAVDTSVQCIHVGISSASMQGFGPLHL